MKVKSIILLLSVFVTGCHAKLRVNKDNEVKPVKRHLQGCSVSDEERATQIMVILKKISDETAFDDETSPQSQAATWLIEEDDRFVCPDDEQLTQRYILTVLYFSTNGDEWFECFANDDSCGTNDNDFAGTVAYLSAEDECEWAGSTCIEDRLIYLFYEEFNNIAGPLPNELGFLFGLEILSIEKQNITGTIPSSLGDIQSLKMLDFDYNQMTGQIPDSIYSLSNLEELDLNNNQLTGTISDDIEDLVSLEWLQLQNNNFTGTFPSGLTRIPLETTEFYGNDFSGFMPLCINSTNQTLTWISLDCGGDEPEVYCEEDCGCTCF